jgi:hypothetical protein
MMRSIVTILTLNFVTFVALGGPVKVKQAAPIEAEDGNNETEKVEMPNLEEVTPEEISKLEEYIKSSVDPQSPEIMQTLIEELSFEKTETLPESLRITSSKILLQFFQKIAFEDRMNMRVYVSEYLHCSPSESNLTGEPISEFDFTHTRKLEFLYQQFGSIFSKWHNKHSLQLSKLMSIKIKLSEEDIQPSKEMIIELDDKLKEFYDLLKDFRKTLDPHLRNRLCNIKNLMNFFTILPRFHKMYKKMPDGFMKEYRYMDIAELNKKFNESFYFFMVPYIGLAVWATLIHEFRFYVEKDSSLFIIELGQNILFKISESIGKFTKRLCHFGVKNKAIMQGLKTAFNLLEDAARITHKKFPDEALVGCSSSQILASLFGFLILAILNL